MSDLELVEADAEVGNPPPLDEETCWHWVTVDMREGPGGEAVLRADGADTSGVYPIVGWLVQAAWLGRGGVLAPTEHRRVVPGVFVHGLVVPVSEVAITRSDGAESLNLSWAVRVDGASGSGLTVVVEPAPLHVEVVPEPATRRVIRDEHNNIVKVVAE